MLKSAGQPFGKNSIDVSVVVVGSTVVVGASVAVIVVGASVVVVVVGACVDVVVVGACVVVPGLQVTIDGQSQICDSKSNNNPPGHGISIKRPLLQE